MPQIHVNVTESQRRRFKAATQTLGFATMSAYLRQKIREAIERSKEIGREVS